MGKRVIFVTGNLGKAEQLARYLNYPLAHKKLDLPEIQSLDIKEIVERKAREAYKRVKMPVLVEDTSLVFKALGKLPGPLIKWFLLELGNNGLCRLLDGYKDRSALAKVCFGFYDGKKFKTFESQTLGKIVSFPKGKMGFGWDPIFVPLGQNKTLAEMTPEEQKKISIRWVAIKKLERFLKAKYKCE